MADLLARAPELTRVIADPLDLRLVDGRLLAPGPVDLVYNRTTDFML